MVLGWGGWGQMNICWRTMVTHAWIKPGSADFACVRTWKIIHAIRSRHCSSPAVEGQCFHSSTCFNAQVETEKKETRTDCWIVQARCSRRPASLATNTWYGWSQQVLRFCDQSRIGMLWDVHSLHAACTSLVKSVDTDISQDSMIFYPTSTSLLMFLQGWALNHIESLLYNISEWLKQQILGFHLLKHVQIDSCFNLFTKWGAVCYSSDTHRSTSLKLKLWASPLAAEEAKESGPSWVVRPSQVVAWFFRMRLDDVCLFLSPLFFFWFWAEQS